MKMSKVLFFSVALTILLGVFGSPACLASFTGTLSSDSIPAGLLGHGVWVESAYPTTFTWTVTQIGGLWHYEYTLTVPSTAGEPSHLIIETSLDLEHGEIMNASTPIETDDPKLYNPGSSNPFMPDDVYGIKFQAAGSSYTVSFDCPRMPVWGDFYAVNGKKPGEEQCAWNAGFTDPDTDPLDPPDNGSIDYHILVPDTFIPAPGAFLLAGIGTGLIGWLRRRRTL